MKNKSLALIFGIFSLVLASFSPVYAQNEGPTKSLIPEESSILQNGETLDCIKFMKLPTLKKKVIEDEFILVDGIVYDAQSVRLEGQMRGVPARSAALTCGIKSGRIPLWLIPFYIVRVIDFLLLMGGLVAVLFMIIGGYQMIVGSYSEDKEKGKNTIKYALFGLVLTLVAYTIVNLVLFFLTS